MGAWVFGWVSTLLLTFTFAFFLFVLSGCQLGDGGARALSSTIASHCNLGNLHLGNNLIGDPGALALR